MFLNQARPQKFSDQIKEQAQDFVSNFDLLKLFSEKPVAPCDNYIASRAYAERVQEIENKQMIVSLGLFDWR